MTPLAGQALKIFAWTALPFGLVMGLIYFLLDLTGDAPEDAWRTGLVLGVSVGLAFGLFMTAVVTVIDQVRRRRVGAPLTGDTRPTHRMRVALPVDAVVQQARNVLWHVAGSHAVEDPPAGTLRVTTRASWWSWGDVVTVTIRPDGGAATLVEVASRPRLRTTLVDYGSNALLVRRVVEGLTPQHVPHRR